MVDYSFGPSAQASGLPCYPKNQKKKNLKRPWAEGSELRKHCLLRHSLSHVHTVA